MFCESCGKNIPDESKFCEFCGSEVISESVIHSAEDIDNGIHYEQEIEEKYEYAKTATPKKSGFIKKAAILVVLVAVIIGGYSVISQFLGTNPEKTGEESNNPSKSSESKNEQPSYNDPENNVTENNAYENIVITINEDDFNWHFEEYYYQIPEGANELSYLDIMGQWKLMAVNYLSDSEEIHFSVAVISEYSPDEAHIGANTSVFLKHQYTKYDGEKYFYDEEESTDLVLCSYGEGILQMALADDKVLDVIFWENEGKQYGQSYLFRDDDNDGFADLIFSIALVR
jgi:hypothetical protein